MKKFADVANGKEFYEGLKNEDVPVSVDMDTYGTRHYCVIILDGKIKNLFEKYSQKGLIT